MKCYTFSANNLEDGLYAVDHYNPIVVLSNRHEASGIIRMTEPLALDLVKNCLGRWPIVPRADVDCRSQIWLTEEMRESSDALVLVRCTLIAKTLRDIININLAFDDKVHIYAARKEEGYVLDDGTRMYCHAALVRMPIGTTAIVRSSHERESLGGWWSPSTVAQPKLAGLINNGLRVRMLTDAELAIRAA